MTNLLNIRYVQQLLSDKCDSPLEKGQKRYHNEFQLLIR